VHSSRSQKSRILESAGFLGVVVLTQLEELEQCLVVDCHFAGQCAVVQTVQFLKLTVLRMTIRSQHVNFIGWCDIKGEVMFVQELHGHSILFRKLPPMKLFTSSVAAKRHICHQRLHFGNGRCGFVTL